MLSLTSRRLTAPASWSDQSPATKFMLFVLIFAPTVLLTLYTVKKSRRLSEFLDALADDSLGLAEKWRAFWRIW